MVRRGRLTFRTSTRTHRHYFNMALRLTLERDREILEKFTDKKTGKTLAQLLLEDGGKAARRINKELDASLPRPLTTKELKTRVKHAKRFIPPFERTEKTMRFILEFPPSVNDAYATVTINGKPRRVLTKVARAYKRNAAQSARNQGAFRMTGKVELTIHIYRPRRAGDVNNFVKIVEDALKGVAWYDDEQVAISHHIRHLSRKRPRIEMLIEQIPPGTKSSL